MVFAAGGGKLEAMRHRTALVLCAALLAAAWVFLLLVLLQGIGELAYLPIVFTFVGFPLTWWAVELQAREWRGRVGVVRAIPVSALATTWILWVAVSSRAAEAELSAASLGAWGVAAVIFVVALPFVLGLFAAALTRGRWPTNGRWLALLGAALAVCFAVPSLQGGDIAGGVVGSLGGYILWLLGVRTWIWRERRRHDRPAPPAPSARALIFDHATRCARTGERIFEAPTTPVDEALWNGIFEEWQEGFPYLAERVVLHFTTSPGIPRIAVFEPKA